MSQSSVRNRLTLWHLVAPYYKQPLNEAKPSLYCGACAVFYPQMAFFSFSLQSSESTRIEECACGLKIQRVDMAF